MVIINGGIRSKTALYGFKNAGFAKDHCFSQNPRPSKSKKKSINEPRQEMDVFLRVEIVLKSTVKLCKKTKSVRRS